MHYRIRTIIYISIFSALTAIGAFIKIPFPIVPLTLQTFFVILSGNLLGARFGALSQFIYLTLGLIGLPIFAYGGGVGYIFQPTFGYLLAYPVAAYFAGKFIQSIDFNTKKYHLIQTFFANFFAIVPIFIIGVIYLYLVFNYVIHKDIEFSMACWTGFIVFIPGDIIKVILASIITIRIKKHFKL